MFYKKKSNYSFSVPSRLIFQSAHQPSGSSSQENSRNLTASDEITHLTNTISQLGDKGFNSKKIKKRLKENHNNDTTRIVQYIMNGSKLKSIDTNVYAKIHNSSIDTEANRDAIIDSLVDNYMRQKSQIVKQTRTAVRHLAPFKNRIQPKASDQFNMPPKTEIPADFNTINPEIARLEQYKSKHSKDLGKSKHDQLTTPKTPLARQAITAQIDLKTDPDRPNATISDYEDSINPFSKETNSNNRTRRVLDGYLYGIHIFNGGDKAGKNMINMEMQKTKKLYSEKWGNRLDYTDLQYGMHLKPYLEVVKSYSKFDRVHGLMASLLLMNDTYSQNLSQKNKYERYLINQFQKLKALDTKDNEDAQLDFLFKIKPSTEAVNTTNWHQTTAKIKRLTDPSRNNALIGEYQGTKSIKHDIARALLDAEGAAAGAIVGSLGGPEGTIAGAVAGGVETNRLLEQSNTRRQLEGAMFAGSIWGGMDESKEIYKQAGKLYNNSGVY